MVKQLDSPIKIKQKSQTQAKNLMKRGSVPVVPIQALGQSKKESDDFLVHKEKR